MKDASPSTDPVLARALQVLSELVSQGPGANEWSTGLASELATYLPSSAALPHGLIATSAVGRGALWHAEQLAALCESHSISESSADRVRRVYHAKMLGHCLAPDQPEFQPVVTILIPVFNRAGPLVEAVQSCLAQTWRPIEILVIDDGSTDDPASALARFGSDVRLVRRAHGGVAGARNLGVREATGDFIHFLDSDDLLLPQAVENAVSVFATVADADLCYGQGQWIDMRTTPPQVQALDLRELTDPIRSMIVEFAFAVPTVMMPRWFMCSLPPFEEDLCRSEDWRYWQALGFTRIKAVGMRTLSAHLRRLESSLHATPQPGDDSHAVAVLRGLRDLVRHPHAWPYIIEYLNIVIDWQVQRWFASEPSDRIRCALSELTAAVQLGRVASDDGDLSLLPMLAAVCGRIERLKRKGAWSAKEPGCAYQVLAAAMLGAIDRAAPLSDRDVAFWTSGPDAPIRDFFRWIRRRWPARDTAALADMLLRTSKSLPRRKPARAAARLQSIIGARLASVLISHWMRWRSA